MANNYETIDELLIEEKLNKKNVKPIKAAKIKKPKTKKSKKFIVSIVALVTVVCVIVGSGIAVLVSHFKRNKSQNSNDKTNSNTSSISTMAIDDMGTELEFPKEIKPKYVNVVSGNANLDEIVEKNDKIYANQENAGKSDKAGTTSIDTKGDTLKVESNGKVKDKTIGYEIVDKETGSTVSKGDLGTSGTPNNFEYNEELNDTYEKEDETESLTYADSDYYDQYGCLVLAKGDIVEKERLEYAKKHYSTIKPAQTTSSNISSLTSSTTASSSVSSNISSLDSSTTTSSSASSNTSSTVDDGVVNKDGTYTIYGMTFLSKADYQQWVLQGYEGYSEKEGIMVSRTDQMDQADKEAQKQLVK